MAAALPPDEVAAWLSTMSSAVPSQVLTNLKMDVTRRRLHGQRFSEILNECRIDDLMVEHLSPLHMARLRKAWNTDFPDSSNFRRASAPPCPAGSLHETVPFPQGVAREADGAAAGQRQVAWAEQSRQRLESPQRASPYAESTTQPQRVDQGGLRAVAGAPQAVLAALVVIVVDRLSCWAGFDMNAALSELRDVLPPPVWDELAILFLKHPPTPQVVELLYQKARDMLARDVALWQEQGAAWQHPEASQRSFGRQASPLRRSMGGEAANGGGAWRRQEVSWQDAPGDLTMGRRAATESFHDMGFAPAMANRRSSQQHEVGWAEHGADAVPSVSAGRRRAETEHMPDAVPAVAASRRRAEPEHMADAVPAVAASRRRAETEHMVEPVSVAAANRKRADLVIETGWPEHGADPVPAAAASRRRPELVENGPAVAPANSRTNRMHDSVADTMPAGAACRRMLAEAREVPSSGSTAEGQTTQGAVASCGSLSRGPAVVAAWVRGLPTSQVPDKEREALAFAVEAEGLDGDSFTKVAHAPQMLAARGLPSPAHALKVRKAWEQVLREDACRQIALETATSTKLTPKAVKMVF